MRLGIDLDGVTYDFVDSVRRYLHEEHSKPLSEMTFEGDWHFYKEWGLTSEEFLWYCSRGVDEGHIFRTGNAYPGALEALRELQHEGHQIHLITARAYGTRFIHNTADWLHEVQVPYDSLTFTVSKEIAMVDVLLDDYPPHCMEARDAGVKAALFKRPYNGQDKWPEWKGDVVDGWNGFVTWVGDLQLIDA